MSGRQPAAKILKKHGETENFDLSHYFEDFTSNSIALKILPGYSL